jgi:sugar lactone lactonase YvrE
MLSTDRPVTVMSSGHAFLEGPRWHEGALYASDFFQHEVLRWAGDGPPETVCTVPAQPSGLGWTPDGALLVVSMVDRRLLRLDGDELVEVADLSEHATWHCNDMVVDGDGRAYVGNFGWDEATDPVIKPAALQRVDPDGSVHVVADELICPNGMAITPDGRTLLVNETFAARVTAFDREPDGSLTNRRVWASFSDTTFETVPEALAAGVILPDGMALDAEGALWLADCHGAGATRVAEGGEVLDRVSTAPHASFATAIGGTAEAPLLFCATTFPYGAGDPRVQHESTMRSCPIAVPAARPPAAIGL